MAQGYPSNNKIEDREKNTTNTPIRTTILREQGRVASLVRTAFERTTNSILSPKVTVLGKIRVTVDRKWVKIWINKKELSKLPRSAQLRFERILNSKKYQVSWNGQLQPWIYMKHHGYFRSGPGPAGYTVGRGLSVGSTFN